MAFISTDDRLLTVLNLFGTDTAEGQERLLRVMRGIIDSADYPGWVSSTLHGGVDAPGTANYIQWRSREDLEARYGGETFRHRTVPEFDELASWIRLIPAEVVFSQRHPSLDAVEITPERGDHTVIIVMGVEPENQKLLLDELAQPDEWVVTRPGYRSHSVLRSTDGTSVVTYAQWESKEHYDTFHDLPEHHRPADVRERRARARALVTSREANAYTCVHTRSATDGGPV
ncbi:MAG: hypothetical protein AVDCRST_MAG66-3986 [uncultured Pseudonocardia sp.]|uniref:ABM domain-containing protein n=1 Tax=uncultured Pseudonocardia sp. TaxID=211455 RepID=A0A6J4QDA0_9PSEU|nr:MAG: hypothetical protein AVDCRST_MAG66-3986 [uncultured Pseudonocardia sp.]